MRRIALWGVTVLLLFGYAGAVRADTVFVAEPVTPVRRVPETKRSPIASLDWGTPVERVKVVGYWTNVTLADKREGFVWGEWLVAYKLKESKTLAEGRREVSFSVDRYLAPPVLVAMCRDVLEKEKRETPRLKELTVRGYLATLYPKGDPLCQGRWAADGELVVDTPKESPVTPEETEISDWLSEAFTSVSREGAPIFAVDSLWIEAAQKYNRTREQIRYSYDRVRWSKTGHLQTESSGAADTGITKGSRRSTGGAARP